MTIVRFGACLGLRSRRRIQHIHRRRGRVQWIDVEVHGEIDLRLPNLRDVDPYVRDRNLEHIRRHLRAVSYPRRSV